MCGITGLINPKITRIRAKKELAGVMQAMHHRGPDGQGIAHCEPAHLGHVRLSIIDIQGGSQPIANEDESIWLVFNGEIYNFKKLRKDLQAKGHEFRSMTDSEVIVHLYEEKGTDLVNDLEGMFAFAIWDTRKNMLFMARDRFGQKPLYYHVDSQGIRFASELKGLMRFSAVPKDIDETGLADYLVFNYVPSPATMIRDVKKLPPGHILTYKDKNVSVTGYFQPGHGPVAEFGNKKAAIREFWDRFDRAVQKRLVADVPLGVFLSGGIDSTAIAISMARAIGPDRVRAFSIGFSDPGFDESRYAQQVADRLGITLKTRMVRPEDVQALFPRLADIADEPVSDNSIVPTFMLSEFARQDITVTLSGDGGDELFMGYPTFNADLVARAIQAIPFATGLARRAIDTALNVMGVNFSNISPDFQLRRFKRGLGANTGARHAAFLGALTPMEVESLGILAPGGYRDIEDLFLSDPKLSQLKNLSAFYLRTYLAEDVLVKVDRATMSASLEARAPFLDGKVADFAFSLPDSMLFHPLKTKPFLRKALAQRISDPTVLKRPKKGFGMPVGHWFRGKLRPLLEKELNPKHLGTQGIFDPTAINRLMQEHFAGYADHRMALFSLLLLELWIGKNL